MSGFVVVIPARYASTRLPGKALLEIAGKTMLQHVYERGTESNAAEVVIATDDARIAAAAETFGATVCMTGDQHQSGTERIAEVCELLLDAGGFVDPIDSFGNTPLWRAVLSCRGDGDCIRVFLTYDANPLLENLSGISPVKLARTIGNYDVERFFSDL